MACMAHEHKDSFYKFKLIKEKIMEQVYRIGIDHGYGNIIVNDVNSFRLTLGKRA